MPDNNGSISFTFGERTDAELKMVLHSRMFHWLKEGGWIMPMAELSASWTPVDVFRFFRIKQESWRAYLLGFMTSDEIRTLDALAAEVEERIAPEALR